MKRVFISCTKCYLSIYAVPDNVLSARNKSQGKYNPVFKDFIGEEVRILSWNVSWIVLWFPFLK